MIDRIVLFVAGFLLMSIAWPVSGSPWDVAVKKQANPWSVAVKQPAKSLCPCGCGCEYCDPSRPCGCGCPCGLSTDAYGNQYRFVRGVWECRNANGRLYRLVGDEWQEVREHNAAPQQAPACRS